MVLRRARREPFLYALGAGLCVVVCILVHYSSFSGCSSSSNRNSLTWISVVSLPISTSERKRTSVCIWTCRKQGSVMFRREDQFTISRAPRMTPHRTLLNHRPPSFASLGSSANSDRGFSSSVRINSEGDGAVTVGVMLRNVLNATCDEFWSAVRLCCTHFGDDLGGLSEGRALLKSCAREKVLYQARADVVTPNVSFQAPTRRSSHLVQLLVHLPIILVILAVQLLSMAQHQFQSHLDQLHNECPISQREQFGVLPSARRP